MGVTVLFQVWFVHFKHWPVLDLPLGVLYRWTSSRKSSRASGCFNFSRQLSFSCLIVTSCSEDFAQWIWDIWCSVRICADPVDLAAARIDLGMRWGGRDGRKISFRAIYEMSSVVDWFHSIAALQHELIVLGQYLSAIKFVSGSVTGDDSSRESLPDDQSEIIFMGTGTSEGIPCVSCLTNSLKKCPVWPLSTFASIVNKILYARDVYVLISEWSCFCSGMLEGRWTRE